MRLEAGFLSGPLWCVALTHWRWCQRFKGREFASRIWQHKLAHYYNVIMSTMASQVTSLTITYSSVCSGAGKKKPSKLRVIGLCEGNSPVTGEFPAQRASNAENVSIWWRHHAVRSRFIWDSLCLPISNIGKRYTTHPKLGPMAAVKHIRKQSTTQHSIANLDITTCVPHHILSSNRLRRSGTVHVMLCVLLFGLFWWLAPFSSLWFSESKSRRPDFPLPFWFGNSEHSISVSTILSTMCFFSCWGISNDQVMCCLWCYRIAHTALSLWNDARNVSNETKT